MLKLNQIYNMDCMDGMKKIDSNMIDCIITDLNIPECNILIIVICYKPDDTPVIATVITILEGIVCYGQVYRTA